MEGNVWAESTYGTGSTFHFTAWLGKSGEGENEIIYKDLAGKKVLLVEDNPINRKLAHFMLTKAGHRLTVAENGLEAVEIYTANPDEFDLILMDIQMPGMDGMQAAGEIRKLENSEERGKTIPIVAMTAQSMKGDREKCLEAGMDDYIPKPIHRDVVFEIIKKWVLKD
jgi:CheY-like chemotaxis protein